MHPEFSIELARQWRDERRREIERNRLGSRARRAGRGRRGAGLRSRAARRLFEAAFALDARESWRAVWDRMNSTDDAGPEAAGRGDRG